MWQREGVRSAAGGLAPQKHRVGCLRSASKFPGRNWFPFGILAGGWAREMELASAYVPHQTELCCQGAQQLSLPLSSSLPTFRAELLTYDLPDAKSRLLLEHTLSLHDALPIW